MKIDGYQPADPKIALEQGSTFTYATPFGEIRIVARIADDDNVAFSRAMAKVLERHARARRLGPVDAVKQMAEIAKVYGDHVVINWETDITSGGAPVPGTPDAFAELMTQRPLRPVFVQFQEDVADVASFRAAEKDELAKN